MKMRDQLKVFIEYFKSNYKLKYNLHCLKNEKVMKKIASITQ